MHKTVRRGIQRNPIFPPLDNNADFRSFFSFLGLDECVVTFPL